MRITKRIYFFSGVILLIIAVWFVFKPSANKKESILVKAKKGEFIISVTSTGELQARNSENILGPSGLQQAGVWQVKITDLIPEGTKVKEGGYVATLDRSDVSNKLKDLESELEKTQSLFTKTRLDTTLDLRTARDELINLKFGYEEKKLVLDQSKYEPPATIRQAEIELDKEDRGYKQSIQNYSIKQDQSKAKMQDVSATLEQQTRKRQIIIDLLDKFEIKAPKPGMVVYRRDWDGKKVVVGSTISPWDITVATLPDLSSMISLTYISEIDINKVKVNQLVQIGVDALTDKKYSGKIISVANVGEQLKNSDAKVFEVKILINEKDTTLRPSDRKS